MGFECASRTHVGLRRKVNEDSLLAQPDRGLWAVADGMGGHEAGEVASAMIAEALAGLSQTDGVDTLVEDAIGALVEVNRQLREMALAGHQARSMGSTIVGLAIADGQYRCFWAGDSRVYRVRGARIDQLSRDHSLVQDLFEAGMLRADELHDHPNANVVTRAVGASETLVVDTAAGEARPGDQFLLASDGLTRLADDDELLEELTGHAPAEAVDRLLQIALERGAPDNVSIVIVKVT